jgi:alkylation response protein AidB-like acyl-CoA dehydrogenase
VDFTLSDEQELVRETARALLSAECPPALPRGHGDDPAAAGALFDRHLRDWVGLAAGPLVDACLFAEEAGAVLLPGPYLATTLCGSLLEAAGHPLASEVLGGGLTGTVAVAGRDGRWCVNDDSVRTFVLEVDQLDRVAIVRPGPSVLVVPARSVEARPVPTLDSTRRVFEVDVPVDPAEAPTSLDPSAWDTFVARATVTVAADLIGVARWVVQTTVAYARERVQFDVPIGSFQGVQFQLVDVGLDLERASAAVYYAAMCVDAGDPDTARAVHVAKAAAGTAARHAARVGMQVHGGIGYTWEHDLHLYLRRAYAADDLLGDVGWHHDRLAEQLFDRA